MQTNEKDLANSIATITMDMEKICRAKETYFCNQINVTPVELKCLRYLLENEFPQVKELASNMSLTAARVTNLLNSLEKKGHISREISSEDRRVIKAYLTPQGREFALDLQDKYLDYHKEIIESMSDEQDLKSLLDTINTFKKTLEQFLKKKKIS
jgi:DNA-binding MarR family transcriptional regulator